LPLLLLFFPPALTSEFTPTPPHTTISLPVQTAVCPPRPSGAVVVLVAAQLSVLGLYLPPVFKYWRLSSCPPQMIISLPVQTAVCPNRAAGALVVLVAVQVSGVHLVTESDMVGSVYLTFAAGITFGLWVFP